MLFYIHLMKRTYSLFIFLILFYIINTELPRYILNTDVLFYNSLSEKLSQEKVIEIIDLQQKLLWVGYLLIPVLIFIKCILIATVLYIGIAFTAAKIGFRQLLNITVKGEFIFLLVTLIKIIWFYFFQVNYKLEDIQYFYPLSALNIIGYNGLDTWLLYPLQTLNLFEVAYIIYLSNQIGYLTKTNADNGLKIVGYSYVPALFLWVCVVMFFTLNYS